MSKATLTIEGFVAEDLELRSANGKSVVNVDVAHTPRKREGNDWVDAGPTLWVQASFWDADAEAIAATVSKGTLVTITGQPELNVYEKRDGGTGASLRLKFGTLGVIPRGQTGNRGAQAAANDGWASSAPAAQNGSDGDWANGGYESDQTPF